MSGPTGPARPASGARRTRRVLLAALIALALLCLAAQLAPSTSAGYLAKIANTVNKAGTAPFFTCTGAVTADSATASFAYKLGETSGSITAVDYSGRGANGTYRGSMASTSATPRACPRDPAGAYTLDGTTSYLTTPGQRMSTNTFTLEVWFKTTTGGGKLMGFGDSPTGASGIYDRHLYLTNAGQVVFGVYPNQVKTIASPLAYTDGAWHHAVATLSSAGMKLYLDGQNVATDPATTTGQSYSGYWRIGYGNLAGWGATQPSTFFFKGSLRYAAVYTMALTPAQIAVHYRAGT
ncbi:LamG domain-containing protein [Arthrobacter sp. TMN-49]